MIKLSHFWLIISLLISTSSAAQCHHKDDENRVILVVGDSLSSAYGIDLEDGWVSLLEQRLKTEFSNYSVINASVSGDTTRGGLTRLKKALPKHQPDIVVIELGGNDGLRGQPLSMLKKNLTQMIELAIKHDAQPVLLGMRIPSNYGARYTEAFHQTYQKLAQEHELAFVEFFLDGVALNPKFIQADGIHPNQAAQTILLDNAWRGISKTLEHCESSVKPILTE